MSKITSEELRKLVEAATPGPWNLCHHLQSKENDEGCSCGYRGVVFGPELEGFAVCQPGHDPAPAGQEGLEPQRYPRATELANAQLIAHLPDLAAEVLKLREREAKMVEALRFYANPVIYEPHPHGPAFDRRDVSFKARAILTEWEARNG